VKRTATILVDADLFARIRRMRDRFDALAQRIAEAYTEVPVEEGLAERDPADQQVLGTLLASKADYLITGDKELLALAGKYRIVTPATFWERHG